LNIYSIIVAYYPKVDDLVRTCGLLLAAGSEVVLVDNTEQSRLPDEPALRGCSVIPLGENTGIAHAQNIGIEHALKKGAHVIVFFDQDSKIDHGFIEALVTPLRQGGAGVVVPVCVDDATGVELPSARLSRLGLPRPAYSSGRRDVNVVDIGIASGTAASKEVFEAVGVLDEELFIDFVDTEWCLRCRSRNIRLRVVPTAVLRHTVGTASINLGVMRLFVHSPSRCYYQIRNCLLLFRRKHVPSLFALHEIVSVWSSRLLLLLFVGNRGEYLRAYVSAVADGCRGIGGKRETKKNDEGKRNER
jgi:rhamnosyltransferase